MAGQVTPLKGTFPQQKQDQVVSFDLNSTYAINQKRWNRDDLVGKKGLLIYSLMMNDEQVKAVMNFKRDAITARGWQFKFREDTELPEAEQDKRKRMFSEAVKRMRGSFVDALNMIATGRGFGFSITEKVYSAIEIDGETKIGINLLLGRDPTTFDFYTDSYGTISKIEQNITGKPPTNVPLSRVIHYVHAPEWDHVFGRSDLREAYRAWYSKTQVNNLWLLYLERFAGGLAVATHEPDSNLTDRQLESVDDALRQIKSLSNIRLPKGMTLEIVMPTTTDAYEKAVVFQDLAIAKALLVPNLLGISHTGQTGAYSQSQTQLEAFFWTLNADAARLEACLNEQLFRDLGDQNWGDGEYPEFCFKPASWEHVKWVIETWKALLSAKAAIPTEEDEAFIRKMLEMPPRDEKSTPLVTPADEQAQDHAERNMALSEEAAKSEAKAAEQERETKALTARVEKLETVEIAARLQSRPDRVTLAAALNKATQRVHFAVIADRTETTASRALPQLSALMARAVKRALGPDEQIGVLTDSDAQDIAAFQLNGADIGKMKRQFLDALGEGWTLGQRLAINEIDRAKGEKRDAEQIQTRMRSLREAAAGYFDATSFRMAANASDAARAIIQAELQNAFKFGKTVPDTRAAIWQRLIARGLTDPAAVRAVEQDAAVLNALNELGLKDDGQVAHYLDTLVRTNTFEALNEARFAEFTDPELADFVVALRYAAVLDSSTTEICEHLNGRTYRSDNDAIWDEFRPPNHFNCRSVLVPVTIIDGWDGIEDDEPSMQPQEGFK